MPPSPRTGSRKRRTDYWPRLNLTVHDDTAAFLAAIGARTLWFFSTKATRCHWQVTYESNACLCFGSETAGIDQTIFDRYPNRCLRIPQADGERCLNLSTAAGIGLYEALRPSGPSTLRQISAP